MKTKNEYIIRGWEAIRLAERDNLTLHKYGDPVDEAMHSVDPEFARQVCRENPDLIYVRVRWTGWTGAAQGYCVEQYFDGREYRGPDEVGIEPRWEDA